ncbi:hypothetical protein [Streptomyces niveus]|uniref:hypothetical protein n=1 Tax=Streptomyces niveus TaxID=193462 RepID=UPI00343FDA5B
MAWDEWEQLKSDAGERSAHMQLNQYPAGDGGGGGGGTSANGDLVVRDDELGKLGNLAYEVREDFRVSSDLARPSTFSASIDLFNDGLDMGSALTELHDAWNSQTATLKDACAHISNHLDFSRAQHSKDEAHVGTELSVSKINDYIK